MNLRIPWPDPRKNITRPAIKALASIATFIFAISFHGSSPAQESNHKWQFFGTPYNTQHEAEAAIHAIGGAYEYVRVVRDRRIFEDKIELAYGIPHEIGALRDWSSYISGNSGVVTETEQSLIDGILTYYNNRSTSQGCTPSTVVTRDGNWRGIRFWSDGTAHQEVADFDIRYVGKPFGGGTCGTQSTDESVLRDRLRCSNKHLNWNADNICKNDVYTHTLTAPLVPCDPCNLVGNPTDVSTGDKFETESDFDLGWISLQRYYHSAISNNGIGGFGHGWTHSHEFRLAINTSSNPIVIGLIKPNGAHLAFRNLGASIFEAADGSGDRIAANGANWELSSTSEVTIFGSNGRVLERRFEDGTGLIYAYDVIGRLATITHTTGRALAFSYADDSAAASIASVSSASATLASYAYNANGQVQSATFIPYSRIYHYEDSRFPLHLTGISVEGGQRYSTFTYDTQGRLLVSQHAGGADKVELAYTPQGGAVVTDALGHQTNYGLKDGGAWQPKPRLPGDVVDSKGTIARTYYDESVDFRRRLDTVTDRNGTQTKHTYAEADDPVTGQPARTHTIQEALGLPQERTSSERRDVASNRIVLTTVGNRETRIVRNARLQPVSIAVRDAVSNQTRSITYSYCEAADVAASNSTCPILGLVKSVDGPRTDVNDVTSFQYYGSDDSACATQPALCTYRKGDLRKVVDALGRATEVAGYDPQGRPLSLVDINGVITDYEYQPRGWLAATKVRGPNSSTESDDQIHRTSYYPTGLIESVAVHGLPVMHYDYDAAMRLINFDDNSGSKHRITLDNAGNRKLEETKRANGTVARVLSRVYNALGQLVALKDSAQNATTFDYDVNGNLELTTDALGRKTRQSYDALNRLKRTLQDVDGLAAETKLDYNAYDEVTKVTDPKGLNTIYSYNGFGDHNQLESPDTGITHYGYNSAGLLTSKQDANDAQAHTYTYDALNRPKTVSYTATGDPDVEYDYDTVNADCLSDESFAVGRVTAMRTEGTELKYCYDRFGQLVRKIQTAGGRSFSLRYAYYGPGRLKSLTYPDGTVADYVPTADGGIQEIGITPVGGTRSVVIKYAYYNPLGPVAGWSYGNGRSLQRKYDLDYRPKSIRDTTGGLSLGYNYNTVGELTELKDGLQSASLAKYDYDSLGRLTVTRDGPTGIPLEAYGYDATGNRNSLSHAGVTTSYTYESTSHRLGSVGATSRSYDPIGNTTAIGGTAKEFVYNANDRMKQVRQGGVVTAGYRYNAKGERVATINGDTGPITTHTLYDEAGHWIGDYDSNGAAVQQAIWMGSTPVGLLAGDGPAQSLKYVQPDHLGTPRAVIDPTRNVAIWTWDAKGEAFGKDVPNQDPDLDGTAFVFNMRFPGQRHDPRTGLSYNYFRDYDDQTGRYIQSDPVGQEGGPATYAYVSGNPLRFIDPNGLQSRDLEYIYKESGAKPPPPNTGVNFAEWMMAEALCGFCDLNHTTAEGLQSIDAPWEMGFSLRGVSNAVGRATARAATSCKVFRNLAPEDEIIPAVLFAASQVSKVGYSGRLTYVVLKSGQLIVGRTPHTSLARGAEVVAAGEARFVNGALRSIDNASGHYRPTGPAARKAAERAFNRAGFEATGKYTERKF